MICHAVHGEPALVDPAGNRGSAVIQGDQHGFSCRLIDILDPDSPRGTVRLHSDCNDISAETQNCVPDAFLFKFILYRVCDVSFGNAAEIDHHPCRQRYIISIHPEFSPVNLFRSRCQRIFGRDCLLPGGKIPQGRCRSNRNVKSTAGKLADLYSCPQDLRSFRRNRHGLSLRMVDLPDVTAFHRAAQELFIGPAGLQCFFQKLGMIRICSKCDYCIQVKPDPGLFWQLSRRGSGRRFCRFCLLDFVCASSKQEKSGQDCQQYGNNFLPHNFRSPGFSGLM